jgi:hypothetical protein
MTDWIKAQGKAATVAQWAVTMTKVRALAQAFSGRRFRDEERSIRRPDHPLAPPYQGGEHSEFPSSPRRGSRGGGTTTPDPSLPRRGVRGCSRPEPGGEFSKKFPSSMRRGLRGGELTTPADPESGGEL